jgi:archaellum component FlaF (FlaF/FlaG flagellin family)
MERLREKIKSYRAIRKSKKYYKKNLLSLHEQLIDFYNSLFDTNLEISIEFGTLPMFDPEKDKVIFGGIELSESVAKKFGIPLKALCFSNLAHEEGERYYFHVNPFIKGFSEEEIIKHVLLRVVEKVEEPTDVEIVYCLAEGVATAAMNRALERFGFEAKIEEKVFGKLKDKKYSLDNVIEKGVPLTYIGYDYENYFKVVKYFSRLSKGFFQKNVRKKPRKVYESIMKLTM